MSTRKLRQWTAVLFLVLLINTAYIAAFNSPTIFYMGNVLLHLVLGVVLTVALLFLLRQFPAAAGFFLAAAALGETRTIIAGPSSPISWRRPLGWQRSRLSPCARRLPSARLSSFR